MNNTEKTFLHQNFALSEFISFTHQVCETKIIKIEILLLLQSSLEIYE